MTWSWDLDGDGTFGAWSSKGNFAPWSLQVFDFNADGPSGQLADHAMEHFIAVATQRSALRGDRELKVES